MRSRIIVLEAALLLVSFPLAAATGRADLRELIDQHRNDVAVVVPVPTSGKQGEFGLELFMPDEFSRRLGAIKDGVLETAQFKLVAFNPSTIDSDEEPLPITDFDGANVLYHLSLARDYYARLNQSATSELANEALSRKIVVRIRANREYNLVTHFGEHPQYNNAAYIRASYAGKWGREVWFNGRKTQLKGVDWYSFATGEGTALAEGNWISGALGSPFQLLAHVNTGMDAAKIPSVIYHEAFHYATDVPGLFPMASEGNPVAEDYANYFASSLEGRPLVAEVGEFTNGRYRRDFSHVKEITDSDPPPNGYNSYPFVPSLFWQVRGRLGRSRADRLVWNSLLVLNGSFRHRDIPGALLTAAHQDQELTADEVGDLEALFAKSSMSFENLDRKFNPGSPEDDARAIDAASRNSAAIRGLPGELAAQGVELTDDELNDLRGAADALEAETRRPGFVQQVRGALAGVGHVFKHGARDVGMGLGYAGSAVFAASETPVLFGTDWLTGLVLGHGLVSEKEQDLLSKLLGAGGGVASVYYAYAGLAAAGVEWATPITASAQGVVYVNELVCRKAHPLAKPASGVSTNRDRYCARTAALIAKIQSAAARAGDASGKAIRRALPVSLR